MMTDDEIFDVILAHKRGKNIQYRGINSTIESEWRDCGNQNCPAWNFGFYDYRVKPQNPKFNIGEKVVVHSSSGDFVSDVKTIEADKHVDNLIWYHFENDNGSYAEDIIEKYVNPKLKPKFKIGDKVTVHDDEYGDFVGNIHGIEFENENESIWYYLFENNNGLYSEEAIEMYVEPEFKPKFEIGEHVIVHAACGDRLCIIKNSQYDSKYKKWFYDVDNIWGSYSEDVIESFFAKYRPFENMYEIMVAMKEHGNYVTDKKCTFNVVISLIEKNFVRFGNTLDISYKRAFDEYIFEDGTIFGVKTE